MPIDALQQKAALELTRVDEYAGAPEYRALLLGIERARALGAREVELVGDSELIVRQVRGDYRVRDAALRDLHALVVKALDGFERWSIRHVRREENARADRLVNEVLDARAS